MKLVIEMADIDKMIKDRVTELTNGSVDGNESDISITYLLSGEALSDTEKTGLDFTAEIDLG